jgi:hypothetical protein
MDDAMTARRHASWKESQMLLFPGRTQSRAGKRYLALFAPMMAAYVILVILISWVTPIGGLPAGPRHLASLLPVAPIAGVIYAIARYLKEEPDEVWQVIQTRAMLAATAIIMLLATAWGFLQEYNPGFPAFPVIILFPSWCGAWGLAMAWAGRKYR